MKYSSPAFAIPRIFGLLLGLLTVTASAAAPLIAPGSTDSGAPPSEIPVTPSTPLSPGAVDALVAPLSDEQTRALLIATLRRDAEKTAAPQSVEGGGIVGFIRGLQNRSIELSERTAALTQAIKDFPNAFTYIFRNLTDNHGLVEFGKGLLVLALMVAAGLLAQRWFNSRVTELRQTLDLTVAQTWRVRLGYLLLRILLDLLAIAIFTLVAYALSFVFFERYHPMRLFVTTYLSVIAFVWVVSTLSRFALAPYAAGLRLLPLDDRDARELHHWTVWLAAVASAGFFTSGLLTVLGLDEVLHGLFIIIVGFALALMLATLAWKKRARVTTAIARPDAADGHSPSGLRIAFGRIWHLAAVGGIAALWGLWATNVLLQRADPGGTALGLFVLLMLPLADHAVRALLSHLMHLGANRDEAAQYRRSRFVRIVQYAVRVVLVGITLVVVGEAWGLGVLAVLDTAAGRAVAQAVLSIVIAVLLAYTVWELAKYYIDRNLPPEPDIGPREMDGEGGAMAPTTRAQTLLPLLRNFVYCVLVVMVTLVVLSSLGVNIGPLLAGAGVVGLAIGFGSQKLVNDIVSGIFFLVDDAFRVGEYIEAGEMKGTVESISMRSMRLRHHRGAVQTLPYGEIAAVKNLSRDWVIMKLEMRLPYDTDIEKVRKIVKKVGQGMQAEEELGRHLLQPLKSQGVLRVEESALIFRMKFMAVPGEQWVLRREAYRRVKDALEAAGISFAHREVTVRVPPDVASREGESLPAGAAATALIAQGSATDTGDMR